MNSHLFKSAAAFLMLPLVSGCSDDGDSTTRGTGGGGAICSACHSGSMEDESVSSSEASAIGGCTAQRRYGCAYYGCGCLNNQCSGGNCPVVTDGCTDSKRTGCAYYGCGCLNDQCSGGYCPIQPNICAGGNLTGPVSPAGDSIGPTGTYTNWFLPDNSDGYTNYAWTLRIERDPSVDGVFWSTQFGFLGNVGVSYFGMQAHGTPIVPGTPPEKILVFAVGAGALDAEFGDVQPPDASKADDFDGNAGWNIHVKYPWIACRDYTLRVGFNGTDAAGNKWLGAWIKDTVTNIEIYVGKILTRASGGNLGTYNIINFTERFGPSALSTCAEQNPTATIFGTMTTAATDGTVLRATRHDNYFGSPLHCPGSRITDVATGIRHEMAAP